MLNGRPIRVSHRRDLGHALFVTGFPYDRRDVADNNVDEFSVLLRKGQGGRRLGAAALDLAWLAAGRLDLYWEKRLKPWDLAAGVALVEAAGGIVTGMKGEPWDVGTDHICASCGPIHDAVLAVLQQVDA